MKKLTTLIMTAVAFTNAFAKISNKNLSEVKLQEVFIAPQGYDDNDNIEVVIDGDLPNACYDLHSTMVLKKHHTILIKQMIRKKDIIECKESSQLNFPIHFSNVISLGELKSGEYTVSYNSNDSYKEKEFRVSKSIERSIDDKMYAPVSSAFIPELIFETTNAQVVLTGIIENTCMNLSSKNIEIKKYNNIFVILPKLNFLENRDCKYDKRPLQQIIDLGKVTAGRYLVHVRSISGRSVNKTFTVIKNYLDHNGY